MTAYPRDQTSLYGDLDGAPTDVIKGADLSADAVHRYKLWRVWDESLPSVTYIMLNPSTADSARDDPTIVRCVNFARAWGYGGITVVNLFALRATDPDEIRRHPMPYAVGPDTDRLLLLHLRTGGPWVSHASSTGRPHGNILVCAWGAHGTRYPTRTADVLRMVNRTGAITHRVGHLTTKDGQPRHPLMLRQDEQPVAFLAGRVT